MKTELIWNKLFTKEDKKTINSGGMIVKEWDINGKHHRLEFTKERMVEIIDDVPTVIIGKI
jgi:hypothetical protein